MSYLLWHTIGDMSGNWLSILDEEHDDRSRSTYNFVYQQRSTESFANPGIWTSLWQISNNINNTVILGQDISQKNPYDNFSISMGGMSRQSFLMGNITDNFGNPIATVQLDLYLTSTGQFVIAGQTDQNGNYQLPTPFAGQNHYIYANYNNNALIGCSVNTLTPNF